MPREMRSTTIAGSQRFLIQDTREPGGQSYGTRLGHLSTPAGLHRRPWFERLRRALQDESLVLLYQPIVCLRNGAVSQYEALVRLADEPGGQLLGPASFLGAAERYGLVSELDRLVIAKALASMAEGTERVAVNLSALSTTDPAMLAHIEEGLASHSVEPRRLTLEITETAAISDMRRAREFCTGVRSLGCSVALDDFGVGFGSLHYLKRLPFDYLKIDGYFIRALTRSLSDQLVVKALVDVARGMGKETVAEYVGDLATLELLCDYGVDYAQGFAIGRPSPARPPAGAGRGQAR
jgi:EAL domain-containing protein (putative c-di-GMP-specific phosphodiesterase class I)